MGHDQLAAMTLTTRKAWPGRFNPMPPPWHRLSDTRSAAFGDDPSSPADALRLDGQSLTTAEAEKPWSVRHGHGRPAEERVQRLNVNPILNLSFTSGTRPECLTIEYITTRAAIRMINKMVSSGVGRDKLPP
jgi:hypothetical protein